MQHIGHVAVWSTACFLCIAEKFSTARMSCSLLIHSPVDWHLGSFQFGVISQRVAVDIWEQSPPRLGHISMHAVSPKSLGCQEGQARVHRQSTGAPENWNFQMGHLCPKLHKKNRQMMVWVWTLLSSRQYKEFAQMLTWTWHWIIRVEALYTGRKRCWRWRVESTCPKQAEAGVCHILSCL